MASINELNNLLAGAKKENFPKEIEPMLATLVDKPFDEPGWIYEVKWDGFRTLAFLSEGETHLASRNSKSFDENMAFAPMDPM